MNDLSEKLNKLSIGCHISQTCLNHLFYADDTVLIAPSPAALQLLISTCEQYAKDNELVFNDTKTVCMTVGSKAVLRDIFIPDLYLDNKKLSWVDEHKYLGVWITSDFSDNKDIKRQIRSIYSAGNMVISKFRKCTDTVKLQLFKSYCSSLYCSHLWIDYSTDIYHKLRVAYNNIFRHLFSINRRASISHAFVNFRVFSFHELVRNHINSFMKRILCSHNSLVIACISSPFFAYGSRLHSRWNNLVRK